MRRTGQAAENGLAGLPTTFSYTQARTGGLSDRRLYAFRDAGVIERLGRGLFRPADSRLAFGTWVRVYR